MNHEEAESHVGNMSLLVKAREGAEKEAEKEISEVKERLKIKLAKIEKQAEKTKKDIAEYVKGCFLAKNSHYVFSGTGMWVVGKVLSAEEIESTGNYEVAVHMLGTNPIIPGHYCFGNRQKNFSHTKRFTVGLSGKVSLMGDRPVVHYTGEVTDKCTADAVDVIEDNDRSIFNSAILPYNFDDSEYQIRESKDQLITRIEKVTNQIDREEDSPHMYVYEAALNKMKSKLKFMEDRGADRWLGKW
jgi:hypothetical protein